MFIPTSRSATGLVLLAGVLAVIAMGDARASRPVADQPVASTPSGNSVTARRLPLS
ncbi:MAG: hypothetical protein SNJ63_03815 [Sphingomonadaceae bacterium]